MNTLLHTCCAPCSIHCVDSLRQEGIEPVSYWFNPNIHPYTEYRSRKTTLEQYASFIGLKLIIDNTYGLRSFVKAVIDDLDHRCFYCYQVRLEQTARYAAEHHFDSFTTTLLVSPYQKHEALIAAGEAAAQKYGVPFLRSCWMPCPRMRKDVPSCVPAGMVKGVVPSSVGTSISPPSAACVKEIGTSQ